MTSYILVYTTGYIDDTSCYMSPEQKQVKDGGTKADSYSLGVIFFEMHCHFTSKEDRNQVCISLTKKSYLCQYVWPKKYQLVALGRSPLTITRILNMIIVQSILENDQLMIASRNSSVLITQTLSINTKGEGGRERVWQDSAAFRSHCPLFSILYTGTCPTEARRNP